LNSKYMKQVDKVKQAELKISDQEKFISQKEDSSQKIAFQNFAKIYNNSKPADVAKILEQIDERDAAMILNMMSKKKAGKIIESMKPEQAAAILLLGNSK
jgi:flagellar motility protein MotE (MotC chaperone)